MMIKITKGNVGGQSLYRHQWKLDGSNFYAALEEGRVVR